VTRNRDPPGEAIPEPVTVLLIGSRSGDSGIPDGADDLEFVSRSVDVLETVPATVDCVVDGTDDPGPALETPVPVVAYTTVGPATAADPGYDAYVARGDGPERLADAIRWTVARAVAGRGPDRRATGADDTPPRNAEAPTPTPTSSGPPRESVPSETGAPATVSTRRGRRFEALIEAMADGVLLTDWEGTIAYLNRAAETALGVSRDQLVGSNVSTLARRGVLSSADIEELQAAAEDLRQGETMVTHQLQVTPTDGDTRTAELRVVPAPAEAAIDGALVTVRDVTRRRETELALRESRERIARLHEAATAIVACRTEDQLYERVVEAAQRVLEFDISSILVRDGDWLVPRAVSPGAPEDSARRFSLDDGLVGETYRTGESHVVSDAREDAVAEPVAESYRSVMSVPVGEHGVFQAVSRQPDAFDENDLELAELLMAHVTETLARVRVEGRLRERERELVAERDRLAALFENVPDPCVAFDFEDGAPIVRAVNEAFEDVFGYDAGTVVGENVDEYIVPSGYENEAEDLNETLQAGERLRTTSKRRTAEGIRDFMLHVVPFNVGERTVQGYAVYTDITDQKERERKLREQNEQLDQFASMVSHDLRNPLNVAEGYLNVAAETGAPDDFDRVRNAHERMNRLIDELLQLARRGDVLGERRPTALGEIAAGAWETVDTPCCTLEVENGATLEADPDRFGELFENLFRNAVEHGSTNDRASATLDDAVEHGTAGGRAATDRRAERNSTGEQASPGDAHRSGDRRRGAGDTTNRDCRGVTVRVGTFSNDRDDGPDGFYVADDGPGIPERERERVLESGYTTRRQGTGLGLSIVQQIAAAHGWSVDVTESAEGGARFEFRVDGGGTVPEEPPTPTLESR
jgi:PAS domain S-box-containing protein